MAFFNKKEPIVDPLKGKKIKTLHLTYLGGLSDFKRCDGKLEVYEKCLEFADNWHKDRTFVLKPTELSSYAIEGKEDIHRRLTATRMVTLGIFSLAAQKKQVEREQYLTLVLTDGRNVIFSHSNRFIDEAAFRGVISSAFAGVRGAFTAAAQNGTTLVPTEQIEKYADLLQKGHITQAEYDAKKKQLLGL